MLSAAGAVHLKRRPAARVLLLWLAELSRPVRGLASGAPSPPPRVATSAVSALPMPMQALAAELRDAPDSKARSVKLVQLGAGSARCGTSPPPDSVRVRGCTAVVHVRAAVRDDSTLELGGSADAALSRGLLSLVVDGLAGVSASEALKLRARDICAAAQLEGALAPSRINGLGSILDAVSTQVSTALAARDAGGQPATVGASPPEPAVSLAASTAGLPHAPVSATAPAASGAPAAEAAAPTGRRDAVEAAARGQHWTAAHRGESVALLCSGGVDSSVALHLLQAAGYDVHAYYLRVWLADELASLSDCPWEEDWAFASAVCSKLDVPLQAVSVQEEYWERVVEYLVDEARSGRTPNPDVMCNSRIKFGVFLDSIGNSYARVASGHYARLLRADEVVGGAIGGVDGGVGLSGVAGLPGSGEVRLSRAADRHKDQSYFLSSLSQAQLSRLDFPLGGLTKPEVRGLASELGLATSGRKDSQGVCFLGRLHFDEFLKHHLGERPGPLVEWESGAPIGQHRGIWFHTVGQRRGIVPGLRNEHAARGPWYVVGKDVEGDVVYVSREYARVTEERSAMEVHGLSWTTGAPPLPAGAEVRLGVQVRHGGGAQPATVELGADGRHARVRFDEPDKGLAPGQFAAFYDGDVCLGAGAIG